MKNLYYFLGTIGAIAIIFITIFISKKVENHRDKEYSDLTTGWEKTFERERQVLFHNYQLIADRTGYYDYAEIGELIGSNPELELIFDRWDGLSLQAIIITDKNNMMFQQTNNNSLGEVVWYAHGDNWEILKKNNFKINQVIEGKNNWFYLRTSRS